MRFYVENYHPGNSSGSRVPPQFLLFTSRCAGQAPKRIRSLTRKTRLACSLDESAKTILYQFGIPESMRIIIQGIVQGVGFRPTVFRVAKKLGLKGHVLNTGSNVEVVINGNPDIFMAALKEALPPLAKIDDFVIEDCDEPDTEFQIIQSSTGSRNSPFPPDAAMCQDCLAELNQPGNRRDGFPFINCTNCGARFSVIYDMPYDRPKTSMDDFPMCMACQSEYENPEDRRFHAQTISCPDCGPKFRLGTIVNSEIGFRFEFSSDPIYDFAKQIDAGKIGAIKSWGGTHIV